MKQQASDLIYKLQEFCFDELPSIDFTDDIFTPLLNEKINGDTLVEQFISFFTSQEKTAVIDAYLFIVKIACAYGIQAMHGTTLKKTSEYLLPAVFWYGFLCGVKALRITKIDTSFFQRELGIKGAQKRLEPLNKLKLWTIEQYEKGKYPSVNQAAYQLKTQVMTQGRKLKVVLSEENAHRTISKWLNSHNKIKTIKRLQ